jgi:plasmid replication initiation protein
MGLIEMSKGRARKTSSLIVKSNALVEASFSLTTAEQHVILAAIAKIDRSEPVTDDNVYTVTAEDVAGCAGFRSKHAYETLRDVAERLWDRTIIIHEKPNGEGKTEKRQERWVRWVQECVYIEREGRIELRFSKFVSPHLTELKNRFTQYDRKYVIKMRSMHSIRLYELLCQWRSKSERRVEIEWLRTAFQLDGKYKSIRDLKRFVINVAVDEINKHSDLNCTVEYEKTGRRVTHAIFKFCTKKRRAANASRARAIDRKTLLQMAQPGEGWDDLARRAIAAGYNKKQVYAAIREAQQQSF